MNKYIYLILFILLLGYACKREINNIKGYKVENRMSINKASKNLCEVWRIIDEPCFGNNNRIPKQSFYRYLFYSSYDSSFCFSFIDSIMTIKKIKPGYLDGLTFNKELEEKENNILCYRIIQKKIMTNQQIGNVQLLFQEICKLNSDNFNTGKGTTNDWSQQISIEYIKDFTLIKRGFHDKFDPKIKTFTYSIFKIANITSPTLNIK